MLHKNPERCSKRWSKAKPDKIFSWRNVHSDQNFAQQQQSWLTNIRFFSIQFWREGQGERGLMQTHLICNDNLVRERRPTQFVRVPPFCKLWYFWPIFFQQSMKNSRTQNWEKWYFFEHACMDISKYTTGVLVLMTRSAPAWIFLPSFLEGRNIHSIMVKKTLTLMQLGNNRCNLRLFFCLLRTFQSMY